jgi:hypothetical protein
MSGSTLTVVRPVASASPGYSSIMAQIPTYWIPRETPHRIKILRTDNDHQATPRVWRKRGCLEQVGTDCVAHSGTWKLCSCCSITVMTPTRDREVARLRCTSHMPGTPQVVGALLRRGAYLRARTNQDVAGFKFQDPWMTNQNRFAYTDSFDTTVPKPATASDPQLVQGSTANTRNHQKAPA